jgi:hypothetical protein
VPGKSGHSGKDGVDGHDGVDGTSVTVTTEAAGANCTNGGEKLQVGAATPGYVCDGQPADLSGYYTKTQADAAFAAASLLGGSAQSTTVNGANDTDVQDGTGACVVGQILLSASQHMPTNWTKASGQTIPINNNTSLFSLIGIDYGGNGTTTFQLPDLTASAPASANGRTTQYWVCTSGVFPS